jgi:hypothetical protein
METNGWTRMRSLAIAVATLLASGCDNSDIQPNGKHHVLTFDSGFLATGEGLASDIILPRQDIEVRGCAKVDPVCEVKVFNYDYDGTTLEADLDPGLRLVEAPLEDGGYRMRVACDQAPAGGVGEVRVRIVASDGVRYADAWDIECHRADGLLVDVQPVSLDIGAASPPRALAAVGAQILAVLGPWANVPPGGQQSLGGLGFTLDDADGAFALDGSPPWGAVLTLDALAPGGTASVVHAGTIQAPLPVEVVPDNAWTLGLTTRACNSGDTAGNPITPGSVAVSTAGHTAAGEYVGVPTQGCDYTFTGSDGTVLSQPGLPCFDRCINAPGGGQLCVSLGVKTACVTVDASGNSL